MRPLRAMAAHEADRLAHQRVVGAVELVLALAQHRDDAPPRGMADALAAVGLPADAIALRRVEPRRQLVRAQVRGLAEGAQQRFRDRRGRASPLLRGRRHRHQQCGKPHQMWITRPYAASTLSCIVSLIVGCGKTVSISSASVSSPVLAVV